MADVARRVNYYYVAVPDRPGEGSKVLAALKEQGINLLAYLGFPAGGGQAQIDIVPESPEALRQAASKAGLKLSAEKRAFWIQGDDRKGAVADILKKLAEAGVNATAGAAACAGAGRYGMILWVAPADYDRAAKALGA